MSQYKRFFLASLFITVVSSNLLRNMTLKSTPALPYGGSDWITHLDDSNRKIWMLSGLDPGVAMLKHVVTYNLDTNDLSTHTDIAIGINGRGMYYTSVRDTIYFVGYNFDFGEFNVTEQTLKYDPHPSISLPNKVWNPCLVNDGRYVYIIGGSWQTSHETHFNYLQIYDLQLEQWLNNAPTLNTGRSRSACHIKDGRIHVFGGFIGIRDSSEQDYTDTIETLYVGSSDDVYTSIVTETWSTIAATLSTERIGSVSASCDNVDPNILYIVGSTDDVTHDSGHDIDIFNLNDQTMVPSNVVLKRARSDPSVACVDSFLYVFGGAVKIGTTYSGLSDWEISNVLSDSTTEPTKYPSVSPSDHPSTAPSEHPSTAPSVNPSTAPSQNPFAAPSEHPSTAPSGNPSTAPSKRPSLAPSEYPSSAPSYVPTDDDPTITPTWIDSTTYTVTINIKDDVWIVEEGNKIAEHVLSMDDVDSVRVISAIDGTIKLSVATSTKMETDQIKQFVIAVYPNAEVDVEEETESDDDNGDIDEDRQQSASKANILLSIYIMIGVSIICFMGLIYVLYKRREQNIMEDMLHSKSAQPDAVEKDGRSVETCTIGSVTTENGPNANVNHEQVASTSFNLVNDEVVTRERIDSAEGCARDRNDSELLYRFEGAPETEETKGDATKGDATKGQDINNDDDGNKLYHVDKVDNNATKGVHDEPDEHQDAIDTKGLYDDPQANQVDTDGAMNV